MPSRTSEGTSGPPRRAPARGPVRGVVLAPAPTPSLPAESRLISSLAQAPGCGQTGTGQCQPIIRLGVAGRPARRQLFPSPTQHPSGAPAPLNPHSPAARRPGLQGSPSPPPRCCSRARQGPLLGRRGWTRGFSPFKAQIAEIEEIPGQAERSFKQTLYNRL